jgi:hypothetical protein
VPDEPIFQTSTPGHIRSLLLDGSSPVLLLGAGASVTSGIPAAGATAEKAARWAWCREAGRSPEDIRIQRSEKLFGVRKQRRDFFERLISPGVAPKIGYRALVRILNEGWINTVLTTNFDHCIEDAKVLENKPHFLVSIKTPDDLVRFNATLAVDRPLPLNRDQRTFSGSVGRYQTCHLAREQSTGTYD